MNNPLSIATASALRMPGATLVTRLKVYDTVTPDGQRGGTPHFHFLCTEMYFVLAGGGSVELLDHSGFSTVELRPHSALIFSPGTLHRLINPDGDLEILVIMQNSGLPERGDNVVCFTDEFMGDDAAYSAAMKVNTVAEAYQRRDRGVQGFMQLKAAFERGTAEGQATLAAFYQQANARTRHLREQWQQVITSGAAAEVARSFDSLKALDAGDTGFLFEAAQHLIHAGDYSKPGFCGHLNRYFDPATLAPEGIARS